MACVVLALGCNDLKQRHNLEPADIAYGVQTLLTDISRSTAGPDAAPPRLVVLSTPACSETPQAIAWGFRGCKDKSRATIAAMRGVAAGCGAPFVDLGSVASVGLDGIHFGANAATPIGEAVALAVRVALNVHDK